MTTPSSYLAKRTKDTSQSLFHIRFYQASLTSSAYFTYYGHHAWFSLFTLQATSRSQLDFLQTVVRNAQSALVYDDVNAIEAVLEILPIGDLFDAAVDLQHVAKYKDYGNQDLVIVALMDWFKKEFFTWAETSLQGMTRFPDCARVEVYKCSRCANNEFFPRYNDPVKLLKTRKGRCGEWANCFTLLARAVGSRSRWVWCYEDHVWTEIYSEKLARWIHVDPCENVINEPLLYSDGWGKKQSYIIAYNGDGPIDVTRRYVRKADQSMPRDKVPEESLAKVIQSGRMLAQASFSEAQRKRLKDEDLAEQFELNTFIDTDNLRTNLPARTTGTVDWITQRGEDGKEN